MNMNPNRKPAGTPAGGQFAPGNHPRPGIELDADFDAIDAEEWHASGFDAESATPWRAAGFEPREAGWWRNAGFDVTGAKRWKAESFDPTDAKVWKAVGAASEHAREWRDAVCTLRPSAAAAALEAWGTPDPHDPVPADPGYLAALRERAAAPEPAAPPLDVARFAEPDDD